MRKNKVEHGMLLDGKYLMDDVIYQFEKFKKLIPECLHDEADEIAALIEHEMTLCDVSERYVERDEV